MEMENNLDHDQIMEDSETLDRPKFMNICQFMFILVQLLQSFPKLFSLWDSFCCSTSENLSLDDLDEQDIFSQVLVYKNLSVRTLVLDALDDYKDQHLWWVKPRSLAWFYEFLVGYYGDDRWIEIMRMSRRTFIELCEILGPSIIKKDTNYKKAIPIFARVGTALYKLTSSDGLGKVAERFAMGKTFVKRVLEEVRVALGEKLGHMIQMPAGQELIDVMTEFKEQCGLPNVCGVLDLTHIYITAPNSVHYMDYYKYSNYNICLQAMCDLSWLRDIFVGFPGSVADAKVLKYSSLWARASRGDLFNEDPINLPWGVLVWPYLLADLGYPAISWIVTPAQHQDAGGILTAGESYFNRRHMHARRNVEQTFGLLKKLFGEVGQKSDMSVDILPAIVRACCILQNFFIEKQENDLMTLCTNGNLRLVEGLKMQLMEGYPLQ